MEATLASGSRQLYLRREFEDLPLEETYCRKTLEHLYYLWGRPVRLETLDPESNKGARKNYLIDEEKLRLE